MTEMTFEEAMRKIEEIVASLEKGNLPLEESLDKFEEAIKLARFCHAKLESAKKRIEKLVRTEDGELRIEPLEEEIDEG